MHTNLSPRNHKTFFISILSAIVLIFSSPGFGAALAHAQEVTPPPRRLATVTTVGETTPQKEGLYRVKTLALSDGTLVTEHTINGPSMPPSGSNAERRAVDVVTASGIMISGVPTYGSGGACSSTAGAMDLGYEDRGDFPNLYRGPTGGGVMPLLSPWGTYFDGFETLENNPMSASRAGLDGKQGPGHIDDYWYRVGFLTPEPYIEAGRQEHVPDSLGDFMRTSQYSVNNVDGDTKFYTNAKACPNAPDPKAATCGVLPRPFTVLQAEVNNLPDGTRGIKRFYQDRGYAVAE